jgi:bacterioferritin
MGSKEREILESAGINLADLIKLLNKALSDEWLAYYQYWIGAKVAVGAFKDMVVEELEEHAKDELRHAEMLVERILQLDGTPVLEPKEWYDLTNCGYLKPSNPDVRVLLDQNIKGEQCAIRVYKKLLDYTKDKDPLTFDMVLEIYKDEVEHEEDLERIVEDISLSK